MWGLISAFKKQIFLEVTIKSRSFYTEVLQNALCPNLGWRNKKWEYRSKRTESCLPLKYFKEPHLSRVSFVDHPGDQSRPSMSLGSLLMPFYLIVALIIWLCCSSRPGHTLLYIYVCVCVCVCVCVVSTLQRTHTSDWYWRIIEEFFFTTRLVKGEERARTGK